MFSFTLLIMIDYLRCISPTTGSLQHNITCSACMLNKLHAVYVSNTNTDLTFLTKSMSLNLTLKFIDLA